MGGKIHPMSTEDFFKSEAYKRADSFLERLKRNKWIKEGKQFARAYMEFILHLPDYIKTRVENMNGMHAIMMSESGTQWLKKGCKTSEGDLLELFRQHVRPGLFGRDGRTAAAFVLGQTRQELPANKVANFSLVFSAIIDAAIRGRCADTFFRPMSDIVQEVKENVCRRRRLTSAEAVLSAFVPN